MKVLNFPKHFTEMLKDNYFRMKNTENLEPIDSPVISKN